MKVSEIPFNMGHEVNDELIEIAVKPEEMKEGVLFLIDELSKAKSISMKGQIAAMAGVYSRIVEDFEASEKLLDEAIEYFNEENKGLMEIYAMSRKGTTLYCANKFEQSDQCFKECIKLIRSHKETAGSEKISIYCLDNWARSKYKRKQYSGALDLFVQAHEEELIHGGMDNMALLSGYISKTKKKVEELAVQNLEKEKEAAEMEENFKNMKDA